MSRPVTYVTAQDCVIAHTVGCLGRRLSFRAGAVCKGNKMDVATAAEEIVGYADRRRGDSKSSFTLASPEEGCRLMRAFVRVQRRDLRDEVFGFVEEILRRQEVC